MIAIVSHFIFTKSTPRRIQSLDCKRDCESELKCIVVKAQKLGQKQIKFTRLHDDSSLRSFIFHIEIAPHSCFVY